MAKIKLIRNTMVDSHALSAGAIVDTDDRTAQNLIAIGKAVAVKKAVKKPETATKKAPETATAPPKRKRKK